MTPKGRGLEKEPQGRPFWPCFPALIVLLGLLFKLTLHSLPPPLTLSLSPSLSLSLSPSRSPSPPLSPSTMPLPHCDFIAL